MSGSRELTYEILHLNCEKYISELITSVTPVAVFEVSQMSGSRELTYEILHLRLTRFFQCLQQEPSLPTSGSIPIEQILLRHEHDALE